MSIEQIEHPLFGTLCHYPNSQDMWIAHIGDLEFMIPFDLLGKDSNTDQAISGFYYEWPGLVEKAISYLNANRASEEVCIYAPEWYPLWIEVQVEEEALSVELGFLLTDDDSYYGNWIVEIKNGIPTRFLQR